MAEARSAPLEGARRRLRRVLHDGARRLDRQRRAAVDRHVARTSRASNLQWVITAYAITFGGFLLLGGRAADLLGRRRVFLVGVVVFTVASFVCGLASVRGRADRRARRAGPRRGDHLAGGALDRHDDLRRGRRAQQGARHLGRDRRLRRRRRRARRRRPDQVPRLGVDLLRQRPGRRRSRSRSRRASCARAASAPTTAAPDVAGAVTVTAGLALLVYAVSKAPDHGWGSALDDRRGSSSPPLLLVAFLVDRVAGAGTRSMPFSIFRVRTVAGANVVGLLLGAVDLRELLPPDAVRAAGARLLGAQDRRHVRRDGRHAPCSWAGARAGARRRRSGRSR